MMLTLLWLMLLTVIVLGLVYASRTPADRGRHPSDHGGGAGVYGHVDGTTATDCMSGSDAGGDCGGGDGGGSD